MATILVIEDQKLTRTILCDTLKEQNYNVLEAADGIEGLSQVESEEVSLVITDLIMPSYDGISFLELVSSCHQEVKLLAWTSLPEDNTTFLDACKIIGKDKIIKKSNDMTGLLDKVKDILK